MDWRHALRHRRRAALVAGLRARPPIQRPSRDPAQSQTRHQRNLQRRSQSELSRVAHYNAGMGTGLSLVGRSAHHRLPHTTASRTHPRGRGDAALAVRQRIRFVLCPHLAPDPGPLLKPVVRRAGSDQIVSDTPGMNRGSIAYRATSASISERAGAVAFTLAASRISRRIVASLEVFRNSPGRLSTKWTLLRIASRSRSGSYQLNFGPSPFCHRLRATDLIVCVATPRSRQTFNSASTSEAYCPIFSMVKLYGNSTESNANRSRLRRCIAATCEP